ncbi:MAG: MBL fold metallo-hydrolase [Ignavibacteriae bacterium]|nr:MBL fold metallo-hydrolase [Ignavibacteriota bacterium]
MYHHRFLLLLFIVLSFTLDAFSTPPPKEYEITKLAEGIYGFVWKEPLKDPIEGNSLFIINENDVVVVDAALFPTSTRLMISELKKLTSKPVRYVVNTHFHDDHVNGNFVYQEEWPSVEFISQRNTRTDIIEKVHKVRDEDIKGIEEGRNMYEQWLKTGKDNNGKELDEARKKRVQELVEFMKQGVIEYNTVKNSPLDITFDDSMMLYRGDRIIKLLWLGRGNTRGDCIIYLPKERIVATGDLLVSPVPFAFGSYYSEWITTLSKLDSLAADVLFLSHGSPQHDRMYLHQVQELLTSLVAEVGKSVASGATLEETQQRVTLSEWKEKFCMKDTKKERAYDSFFIAPAVERAYRQAKGEAEAME